MAHADLSAEHQLDLRALKNRLQTRFPSIKSSHLSEALAVGLGYRTNAALRSAIGTPQASFDTSRFQPQDFRRRLIELDHPLTLDYRVATHLEAPKPSEQYLDWLTELKNLKRNPDRVWDQINALRRKCAGEFARVFNLGRLEGDEKTGIVKRWDVGVDHGACLPNWGACLRENHGGSIHFPATDHARRFYESFPVTSTATRRKNVEICTAMVSMPYSDAMSIEKNLEDAAQMAGCIGWTCSLHPEWSWYAPGKTTLVLFQRTTGIGRLRATWASSFKRWLIENRSRLLHSARPARRMVAEDIINCPHVPLDLRDFADCRQRYLRERAPQLYWRMAEDMAGAFERLMDKWAEDTHAGPSTSEQE